MADKKLWITEGLVIAIIPAIGYWFAYLYELGYCDYFNIPTIYIDISIHTILAAIFGTIVIILLFHFIADLFYGGYFKAPLPIKRAIRNVAVPTIIVVALGITIKLPSNIWITYFVAIFLPLIFVEFIEPLISQKDVEGYPAKLEAATKSRNINRISIMDTVADKFGIGYITIFLYLLMTSILVFAAGGIGARTKEDFAILKGKPEMIVLKQYNNYLVAAKYNPSTNTILNQFKILPINESFTYEHIVSPRVKGIKRK